MSRRVPPRVVLRSRLPALLGSVFAFGCGLVLRDAAVTTQSIQGALRALALPAFALGVIFAVAVTVLILTDLGALPTLRISVTDSHLRLKSPIRVGSATFDLERHGRTVQLCALGTRGGMGTEYFEYAFRVGNESWSMILTPQLTDEEYVEMLEMFGHVGVDLQLDVSG
jgi:hypothetical protein